MKEKLTIILGFGIALLVVFTLFIYLIAKDTFEIFDIASPIIVIILVATSTYIIWDRLKNIKAGLPAQDERLKNAGYKAGYYGFIAAIWSAVGSNMGSMILFDQELRGGLVTAAVVLISGIVFMISYLFLAGKGN